MACSLISVYFHSPRIRDMLNFGFLDKDLRIGSPAHFVYDFLTEMFFMLYSINLANFIAWLFLLLEMLGNICIAIVFYPGCDVLDFDLSNQTIFSTRPKSEDKNLNILTNKRAFKVKRKAFFIIFKGLSVIKNCLRP